MNYTIILSGLCCVMHMALSAQDLIPTETEAVLNVKVTNEYGKPGSGDTVLCEGRGTGKLFRGITDAGGTASFLLPAGKEYEIKIRDLNGNYQGTLIQVPQEENLTINYEFTQMMPVTYTLDHVLFETGKAALSPGSFKELNELVEVMKHNKEMKIEIEGHTDNVGDEQANMRLSQARAEAVRNYLIGKGVEPPRVLAKGYGSTRPVAYNDTPEGRKKNRRTQVRILSR